MFSLILTFNTGYLMTVKRILLFIFFLHISCICYSRSVFVSSSKGLDSNDGYSPKTPLKTIKAAQEKGDTIYLSAGDIFFEYVELHNKTLTRYGKGKNPEINGFRSLRGEPWVFVGDNIWKIDLTSAPSSGYVVTGTSELNNIGCFYESETDALHGCKCSKFDDLKRNWDFYQSDVLTYHKIGSKCFDVLFLYYTGNPNELNLSLSVGSHYGIRIFDSSVERVNVKGFGTGGINVYGTSNVRNCRIDVIGGSTMLHGRITTSLGNGIDFYVAQDANDCVIEGNYISRCFDCGGSIQAEKAWGKRPKNVVYRDNLISHCCQGWEDFLRNGDDAKFENCRFENNYVVFAGESGFGYPDNRFKYCNLLGNNFEGDRGMIIRNNTFVGGNYYCSGAYKGQYKSNIWEGNVHYIARGSFILSNYIGTENVLRISSRNIFQPLLTT